MAYDEMGNYTGYDASYNQPVSPYDFEEEDRKKEELKRQLEEQAKKESELASEVSRKEEIIEYGDGSRTVKSTKEIPAKGKVQPVAPTDYNASIAQQESGNRPDIGYHDRSKGSAYGTYGMTSAGYEDARRSDPSLPADITQATPEQQTQAQNAYTQQNAKYLQAYGVEPTQNNLAAAHFLGAKGLSDYLKTGQISEAAAKANGGVENVKRIVDQRLGGQAAPASGAVKQPLAPVSPEQAQAQQAQAQAQPEGVNAGQGIKVPGMGATQGESKPYIQRYQDEQNDPNALMKLSTDTDAPDWMKDRARNRAADLITQQREMQNAQEKVSSMSETELAKAMREKTTGGSWVKAIFYAAIGAKNLAQAEGAKLGLGTEKTVTGADGKAYMVKVAANGTPLEGYSSETGKKLSAEELVSAVGGGGTGAAKWNTTAETYTDKSGNLYQKQNNDKGQTRIVNAKTGERYTGDEALKRERDVAGATADERKQGFKRENINSEIMASIQKKRGQDVMGALSDYESQSSKPLTDEDRMSFMRQYGGLGVPGTTGQAAPLGQAPAAAGKVTPIAPEGQAQAQAAPIAPAQAAQAPQQAATAVQSVKPGYDASGMPVRMPTEGAKAYEKRYNDYNAQQKLARESESTVKTTEQNEFVKETKPAVGLTSSDGQAVSNARRQQLDIVKNNPSVVNILNGQGTQYDQARRIMINAVSGAYGSEEKKQLADDLGQVMNKLTEAEQGALQEFVNLNTIVNAKTLRANAGPGAVSDAEQRANKEANVGNVDRIPAYAAMAGLHRSQFNGDLAASKQAFLADNPQIKTTSEFNSAWQKQEALRLKEYQAIAKARFDVMGKAPATSASPEAIKAYRDRVFRAFEAYPAPQYDAATNKWNYQTANARRAAMASLIGQ